MKVDVAINYYGKPCQTLLTIESLLEHSGTYLDVIYLIREPRQPRADQDTAVLTRRNADRLVVFTPARYLGWGTTSLLSVRKDAGPRRSVRYQYALEETDKPYLFVTHNNALYTAGLVGELLRAIKTGPHAGAGSIGQCWNCPASAAGLCHGDSYSQLKLSYVRCRAPPLLALSLAADPPPANRPAVPRTPSGMPPQRVRLPSRRRPVPARHDPLGLIASVRPLRPGRHGLRVISRNGPPGPLVRERPHRGLLRPPGRAPRPLRPGGLREQGPLRPSLVELLIRRWRHPGPAPVGERHQRTRC